MSDDAERRQGVSRKAFVQLSGAGLAAAGLVACNTNATHANGEPNNTPNPNATNPPGTATEAAATSLSAQPEAYVFLLDPERRFVDAAVARLIPADDLGPGALEAGVPYYIDQQLNAEFGYAARMYMNGPWAPGTATQGYQLPLNPRQVYRIGIAETNDYCHAKYGKTFDGLSADQQDATLIALQKGDAKLPSLPAVVFYQMLWQSTVEGFFSDPMYGGNRDMAGWKLVGFPGVAAYYRSSIGPYTNKLYSVAPVSIANEQQQMEQQTQPSDSPAPQSTQADAHTTLRVFAQRARNARKVEA